MSNLFKKWTFAQLRYEREIVMQKAGQLNVGIEKDPDFARDNGSQELADELLRYVDQITAELEQREVEDIPF